MSIQNKTMQTYPFLKGMFDDPYFPAHLVEKGKQLLIQLCEKIESEQPADLKALYELTNKTTDQFNELQEEFWDADSEIETAARECICEDFYQIAKAYNYDDAYSEKLTANRDW